MADRSQAILGEVRPSVGSTAVTTSHAIAMATGPQLTRRPHRVSCELIEIQRLQFETVIVATALVGGVVPTAAVTW